VSSKAQQIFIHEAQCLPPEQHRDFLIRSGADPEYVDSVGATTLLRNLGRYLDGAYGTDGCDCSRCQP
jgi:hypothetical protein